MTSQGGTDAPAPAPHVNSVAVRLPAFWPANPSVWFLQAECQFQLAGISTQPTKFRHVVSVLPPEVASDVADVLMAPMGETPYDTLKSALIERTMASKRRRYQQLLSAEDLGDRRPSQFLRHLQGLLGDRASSFDERLLKELFLQRLPTTVQMILATATNLSLSELSLHADKIMEVAPPPVCAVASHHSASQHHPAESSVPAVSQTIPASELSPLTADIQSLAEAVASLRQFQPTPAASHRPSFSRRDGRRPRSRSPRTDNSRRRHPTPSPAPPNLTTFCWYHWSFGAHARNCTPPCTWPGNQPGDR
ncbi:uncharacterized protein LOC135392140 [Ornithodoros turicata]|uniref:uncharacterized protein LOC135392140 n=1 Tax=Ornithodoros turicata TaxID=34597 RepID=UPI0031394F4B